MALSRDQLPDPCAVNNKKAINLRRCFKFSSNREKCRVANDFLFVCATDGSLLSVGRDGVCFPPKGLSRMEEHV